MQKLLANRTSQAKIISFMRQNTATSTHERKSWTTSNLKVGKCRKSSMTDAQGISSANSNMEYGNVSCDKETLKENETLKEEIIALKKIIASLSRD